MTRAEWIALGGAVAALAAFGAVSFHGSIKATGDHGSALVRAGLSNVTSDQDDGDGCRRWQAPAWEMAKAGTRPLRPNHPLYRRPEHIGANRHKVMCDGWDGWYYDAPENEGP